MRNTLLLVASSLTLFVSPADAAERKFTISSFDRIRIDGPYKVRMAVGVPPFASATGSSTALDGLAIDVQGRTLVIHVNRSTWGGYDGEARGPVEISVGSHELSAAWVNGSGSVAIDQVKGLRFDLAVDGSGAATIDQANVDQLQVSLGGTGSARIGGSALKLTASARGTASLDAANLDTKDVVINADGPSVIKVSASGTAKVDAVGVASIMLAGNPSCTVRTQGSATVEGCR